MCVCVCATQHLRVFQSFSRTALIMQSVTEERGERNCVLSFLSPWRGCVVCSNMYAAYTEHGTTLFLPRQKAHSKIQFIQMNTHTHTQYG